MKEEISRKELFTKIRKAQSLFHQEEFTKSFNLLTSIEKYIDHTHIRSKVANIKIQCLIQVGNIGPAIDYIESLITEFPLVPQMHFLAATFYHKLEDFNKAQRLYLRSVCLSPPTVRFSLQYAQFLRERNRPVEAGCILIRCLRENRKKFPPTSMHIYFLYLELALIYYYRGTFWRALNLFRHASQLQKDFPYHDLIAEIYLKKHMYNEALVHLELHFEQWGKNDAEALFLWAKCLAGLNRKTESLKVLTKCRKIWGELVVTAGDMNHLSSLMQDGTLKKIPNLIFEF